MRLFSNIAEIRAEIPKEFRQFLAVGIGSVAELETQLIMHQAIEYISHEELQPY
jgi:four helix bundle protein